LGVQRGFQGAESEGLLDELQMITHDLKVELEDAHSHIDLLKAKIAEADFMNQKLALTASQVFSLSLISLDLDP